MWTPETEDASDDGIDAAVTSVHVHIKSLIDGEFIVDDGLVTSLATCIEVMDGVHDQFPDFEVGLLHPAWTTPVGAAFIRNTANVSLRNLADVGAADTATTLQGIISVVKDLRIDVVGFADWRRRIDDALNAVAHLRTTASSRFLMQHADTLESYESTRKAWDADANRHIVSAFLGVIVAALQLPDSVPDPDADVIFRKFDLDAFNRTSDFSILRSDSLQLNSIFCVIEPTVITDMPSSLATTERRGFDDRADKLHSIVQELQDPIDKPLHAPIPLVSLVTAVSAFDHYPDHTQFVQCSCIRVMQLYCTHLMCESWVVW